MITVMTIGYIGCVFVAFKVIKIKPTPVSIALATLIGFFMLGGVVIGWKQAAPLTGQMFLRRHVVQVLPLGPDGAVVPAGVGPDRRSNHPATA